MVFHLMVYDITLVQKISILRSIWHVFQLNVMGIWRQCYELNRFYLRKQIQYITYFQQAWSIHKELSKCMCVNVPFFSDLPLKLSNHMSMIFVDKWNWREEWSFWFSAVSYCEHRTIFKWCMLDRNSHITNKVFMKKSYTFEDCFRLHE